MAKKAEGKERKGLFERAIDAVSSRDEKAAAEEAEKEAAAARAQAAREASERRQAQTQARTAGAQARAAQAEAKEAGAEAKAAEERASAAEAELARMRREKKIDEVREKIDLQAKERAARQAEAEAKAKAEAEAQARTYVVKSGDSLSKIARELYGDAGRWPEIFEANKDKIKDPNLIYPGQEFKIP